ncbi:MAG: pyruvate kinase [bacterium]
MSDLIRNTKIVVTFGPAIADPETAKAVLFAGADIIRLNLSHGNHELHAQNIQLVRELSKKYSLPVGILLDLQGPKIRTGLLKDGKGMSLKEGETLKITIEEIRGDNGIISTSYKNLPSDIQPGNRILLDDGSIELKVVKIEREDIYCEVIVGGMLGEHKGMNFPDAAIRLPSLTEKDERDLKFGLEQGIDYIALSFVRESEDIIHLRKYMKELGYTLPIIAKIETPQAVENIDKILHKVEGVMVARGDLGVEMSLQSVPVAQKMIVKKANQQYRLVIVATQMLDSMIRNPFPTRAEVSDVANAIFDGADAVMLSGETSIGKYPLEAIKTMSSVAFTAEESMEETYKHQEVSSANAIATSACYLAKQIVAKAIVVYTVSGTTALYISKQRPKERIIALTPHEKVYHQMSLYWNVTPLIMQLGKGTEEMLKEGERVILENNLLEKGDCVIVVAGTSFTRGAANMIKIHCVGD